jgi:hypothetical protein
MPIHDFQKSKLFLSPLEALARSVSDNKNAKNLNARFQYKKYNK